MKKHLFSKIHFAFRSRIMLPMVMLLATLASTARAEITLADARAAAQRVTSGIAAFKQSGGDISRINALMAQGIQAVDDPLAAYRAFTHAMVLINGGKWSPAGELATALDFSIDAKVIGQDEPLHVTATFLFDTPVLTDMPYRMELDLLRPDGAREATVQSPIMLIDGQMRRRGETAGITFDPSRLVRPGEHTIRGRLVDGRGKVLYQYYRSFVMIPNLAQRLAELEKAVESLPDQESLGATTARYLEEITKLAHRTYLDHPLAVLAGFVQTSIRGEFVAGSAELMDYGNEVAFAEKLAAEAVMDRNLLENAKGSLRLAYRSGFDGKLVPFRVYVPLNYNKSKKYSLVVLLHGSGGDENTFFTNGAPRLNTAEERGYILAAPNGRGPSSGYTRESGAQQDVMDVLDLVQKHYSIDPARTYLAGHSMGSMGAWTIGLTYRDRFSALACIAGSRETPALLDALASSGRKPPIIIFAGGKDSLASRTGGKAMAEMAKSLGYRVKYVEFPEADHWTVIAAAIQPMFDWFDSSRK